MAARRPLYFSSGNLREMSSTQIDEIVAQVSFRYSQNPSVTLSVSSTDVSPNIGQIADTRLQAGSTNTNSNPDVAESGAAAVNTKTVNINRTQQAVASVSSPSLPSGFTFPLYWTGSAIRRMTHADFIDTFITPAVSNLGSALTGTAQGGTYRIHTESTLAGHTLVSSNPVFTDTRADAAAFNTFGEVADQPTTIQNYFLFQIDGQEASYTQPVAGLTADNNIKTFAKTDFDALLEGHIRNVVANTGGSQIFYTIAASGSGNTRGSGMVDTKLNSSVIRSNTGSSNIDTYSAQNVPAGSPVTEATYFLRINVGNRP